MFGLKGVNKCRKMLNQSIGHSPQAENLSQGGNYTSGVGFLCRRSRIDVHTALRLETSHDTRFLAHTVKIDVVSSHAKQLIVLTVTTRMLHQSSVIPDGALQNVCEGKVSKKTLNPGLCCTCIDFTVHELVSQCCHLTAVSFVFVSSDVLLSCHCLTVDTVCV